MTAAGQALRRRIILAVILLAAFIVLLRVAVLAGEFDTVITIPKSSYPYKTPVLVENDNGDPLRCLERVLVAADWKGFSKRKAESQRRGKYRGIGLCTFAEACGLAPSRIAIRLGARGGLFESATVRVHPTGDVTVLMGTHNHGQGHETTFAQIISEKLGVPADSVEIVFGDTDKVQFGLGTYGSRSLAVG